MFCRCPVVAAVIVGMTICHAFAPPMSAIVSPHCRSVTTHNPSSRTGLHESLDPESLKQEMLRNPSQSKDILMYQMYEEWRKKYKKGDDGDVDVDPNRFMEFKRNYLQMQKRYERKVALARRDRKDPPPLPTIDELNEYADLTTSEYHRLVRGGGDPPFQETSTVSSPSSSKTTSSSPPKKVKPRTSLAPRPSPTAVPLNPQETTTTTTSMSSSLSSSSLSSPPAPEPSTTVARPAPPSPPKTNKNRRPTRREKQDDGWKQAMLQNPSQSKDIMIYQLYQEWQQKYKKGGGGDDTNDEDGIDIPTTNNRFMEFKSNYMRLKQQHEQAVALAKMEHREPPPFPEINEFADLTPSEYHRRNLQQQANQNENEKSSARSLLSEETSSSPTNMDDTDLQEPPKPQKIVAPSGTTTESIKQQAASQSIIPDRKEEKMTVTPKKVVSRVHRGTTRPPYISKNKTNAPTDDLKQAMLKNPSQSKDIMIFQVYEEWRKKYNKGDFDKHRFMEFKTNYMRMQQHHQRLVAIAAMERQPAPPPPEINEYADMTKAEYHRLLKANQDREEQERSSGVEETKEAPQVIVWGPESDRSSGSKKVDGIRKPYVRRTKHATKAMPPIRVEARSLDSVSQETGSTTQGQRQRRSTQEPFSVRPDEQEIRRQTSQSLTRRSAISTGSSPISVDIRGQNADQMAVDFPERNSLPARGGPRRPGISDQETRAPLKTVDPSSSYAAHNKVDLKKMPDVPGVSDQETKLPPRRVNTDYYTQAPKMICDDDDDDDDDAMVSASIMGVKPSLSFSSTGTGVASDQDTKLPPKRVNTDYFTQAPHKPDVERTAPGVSDQETRSPASNLDPSGFYAAENKQDLRRMAAVPHKGSSGSLSRQRIDSTAPYPRDMVRARISVSDQERRVPSELVDTGSYSPARDYTSRFSAMQGTLRSFGGKRSFRVTPESLSDEIPESEEEPSKPTPVAADQKARAPSNRINPDSVHAAHWPL